MGDLHAKGRVSREVHQGTFAGADREKKIKWMNWR